MTQPEIAEILGLTQMRVCQIEKRALRKLKAALKRRGIDEALIDSYLGDRHNEEGKYDSFFTGAMKRVKNRIESNLGQDLRDVRLNGDIFHLT